MTQPDSLGRANRSALHSFKLPLEIAPCDEPAAESHGAARAPFESAGTPMGAVDMSTGAHSLGLGVTLITNNTREFTRIKRLKTADWARWNRSHGWPDFSEPEAQAEI